MTVSLKLELKIIPGANPGPSIYLSAPGGEPQFVIDKDVLTAVRIGAIPGMTKADIPDFCEVALMPALIKALGLESVLKALADELTKDSVNANNSIMVESEPYLAKQEPIWLSRPYPEDKPWMYIQDGDRVPSPCAQAYVRVEVERPV